MDCLGDLDRRSGNLDFSGLLIVRDLLGGRVDVTPGEDPDVSDCETFGRGGDWSLAVALVEGSLDRGEGALIGEHFRGSFNDRGLHLEEVGLDGILDRTGSETGGARIGERFFVAFRIESVSTKSSGSGKGRVSTSTE